MDMQNVSGGDEHTDIGPGVLHYEAVKMMIFLRLLYEVDIYIYHCSMIYHGYIHIYLNSVRWD